jgi:branched-chain amino acid aminotransferase
MLDIKVDKVSESELNPLFEDPSKLGFGLSFTDHMFTMRWKQGKGWHDATISKLKPFSLHPASIVFHYGQEIFEGLKAFASTDGDDILLFRPDENVKRFNRSAARLCMPVLDESEMMEAIEQLVLSEKRWIPRHKGASLYIRPTMIGVQDVLGVKASDEYLFFIILSPVGPYYPQGFKPIDLFVADTYVRAVTGGVGEAKCGGNYAASLLAGSEAKAKGFAQVLWLDGVHRKYIEEVGAMNLFLVYGDKLVTPALNGSILPGITRKSIIKLAKNAGVEVEEREIAIDDVVADIDSGKLTEIFGSGTAASVSPVGSLFYKEKSYVVGDRKVGTITTKLYNKLQSIQYGEVEDTLGWVRNIGKL